MANQSYDKQILDQALRNWCAVAIELAKPRSKVDFLELFETTLSTSRDVKSNSRVSVEFREDLEWLRDMIGMARHGAFRHPTKLNFRISHEGKTIPFEDNHETYRAARRHFNVLLLEYVGHDLPRTKRGKDMKTVFNRHAKALLDKAVARHLIDARDAEACLSAISHKFYVQNAVP